MFTEEQGKKILDRENSGFSCALRSIELLQQATGISFWTGLKSSLINL